MELSFDYNGEVLTVQSIDTKEKVKDIFLKCKKNNDIKSLVFLYSGTEIDANLIIGKIINRNDLERKKMNFIVINKKNKSNPCLINSKDIICPKCGECAKIDIKDYKIFFQCIKGGHNIGNIFLKEFENTQKIDISKIICDECKTNNKANSYKNLFYRCNNCKINLCIQCQNKHQNEYPAHNFINYDDKNYFCEIDNEKYAYYCKTCEKNICLFCKKQHKEHELINYENILPDLKEEKDNIYKLRNNINEFKRIIDELIIRLSKIKDNIEYYYEIHKSLYNTINNKNINYEILYSFNQINNIKIKNDINEIIKIKNNDEKIKKLNEIYEKMSNKIGEDILINCIKENHKSEMNIQKKSNNDSNLPINIQKKCIKNDNNIISKEHIKYFKNDSNIISNKPKKLSPKKTKIISNYSIKHIKNSSNIISNEPIQKEYNVITNSPRNHIKNNNNIISQNSKSNSTNNNNNQNSIFDISESEKLLYKNIFDNQKEPNMERIKSRNAINIWKDNNVDDESIRALACLIFPLENKGFLNLKEFQVACHLLKISTYIQLPPKLPLNLINFLGRNNNNMNDNNFQHMKNNTNINNISNNNEEQLNRTSTNSASQYLNTDSVLDEINSNKPKI